MFRGWTFGIMSIFAATIHRLHYFDVNTLQLAVVYVAASPA